MFTINPIAPPLFKFFYPTPAIELRPLAYAPLLEFFLDSEVMIDFLALKDPQNFLDLADYEIHLEIHRRDQPEFIDVSTINNMIVYNGQGNFSLNVRGEDNKLPLGDHLCQLYVIKKGENSRTRLVNFYITIKDKW